MLGTFPLWLVMIMRSPRSCSIRTCLQAGQTHLSGCTGELEKVPYCLIKILTPEKDVGGKAWPPFQRWSGLEGPAKIRSQNTEGLWVWEEGTGRSTD